MQVMQVFIYDVLHFEAFVIYRPFRDRLCYLVEQLEAIAIMLEVVIQYVFDLFAALESQFPCIRDLLESVPDVLVPPFTESLESAPSRTRLSLSLLS